MSKKKILVMSWDDGAAEPSAWYRVDEKNEGNRFFQNLKDNFGAVDGEQTFEVKYVTEKEWKEAVIEGAVLA